MLFAALDAKLGQEIARAVGDGLKEGLKTTAEARPDKWLDWVGMLAVLGLFALLIVLLRRGDRKTAQEHNALLTGAIKDFHSEIRSGRQECHDYGRELAAKKDEQLATLGEVAADLRVATGKIEGATSNLTQAVTQLRQLHGSQNA